MMVTTSLAPDTRLGLLPDDAPALFEGMRRTLPITCNYRETADGDPAPWGCEGLWQSRSDPDRVVRAYIVINQAGGVAPQDVAASGATYDAQVVIAVGRCSDPAFEPGVCDFFADLAGDVLRRQPDAVVVAPAR